MKNKVTLKELAKLLHVSVSTVSKALHDSPEISPKTGERVKELARLHNYRPNPVAVNLKSSKSNTIGVIIPNISNSFFANVLSGLEARAQKTGLQVITYISDESLEREQQITDILTSGFVDGVLIAISEETNHKKQYEHLFNLIDYNIPVVLYDRVSIDFPVDKIGIDDEQTFEDATRLLRANGLKKIGVAISIHHLGVGKLRIKGYKNVINNNEDFYIANSSRLETLREKIEKMLLGDRVEAILCADFESTMKVYRLAYEHDIKIPEDLKVIGFINEQVARYLTPSISYIEQFPEKIGEDAVNMLAERIEKKLSNIKPINKTIYTKLVHLESTRF